MVVAESWIDQELAGCQFEDMRLGKRFRKLSEQLSDGTGKSIPFASKIGTRAVIAICNVDPVASIDDDLWGSWNSPGPDPRFAPLQQILSVLAKPSYYSPPEGLDS